MSERSRQPLPPLGLLMSEAALLGSEAEEDFTAGLDRLVNGGDELERFAALQPIDESRLVVPDALDHVSQKRDVSEPVDIGRILPGHLQDVLVTRALVLEVPGL